jgi:aerobic-type carbon monoxide dehydrogenase small subunit (CoxS/CutS family)
MIVAADAFLAANPDPTEDEIKRAMNPYLCRCGTHYRIVAAIKAASR